MNMQRIFHTPEGVRDIYGEECSRKKRLQKELHQVFSRNGYEDIETPGFEYFEVFSNEVGTIPSKDLYKFFDREGNRRDLVFTEKSKKIIHLCTGKILQHDHLITEIASQIKLG